MQDRIANLCARLLKTEEPAEIPPVAADLRYAIHDRVDRLGETACKVLLLDSIANSALGLGLDIRKKRPRTECQESI